MEKDEKGENGSGRMVEKRMRKGKWWIREEERKKMEKKKTKLEMVTYSPFKHKDAD